MNKNYYASSLLLVVTFMCSMAGFASQNRNPADPYEGFNRVIFKFNDTVDYFVVKPVAKTYRWVAPKFVERGVSNFFANLGEVTTVPNHLLQGKFGQGFKSTGRFLINSTIGVAGLWDVASPMGLEKTKEDFGQTLGKWNIPSGPYLVLPILGPSTVRDAGGLVVDTLTKPTTWIPDDANAKVSLMVVQGVDKRAALLDSESMLTGDKYSAIRDFYLQIREYNVQDGVVEDDFINDDSDESEEEFLDESF
ncbi:MlaA family lipoprotein [Gynuella sp.]|uniref:MlaA family lipoprotein n=1 Tax=Gynuella sp. TaxID=2969146 RepID=UPI003D153174